MSEEILKVLEKLKHKSNYQIDGNDGSYFIELFANEIYILCKFMEDLQQKVEQLENIRKETIECIETDSIEINTKEYGNLTVINSDDLLNILNKGE